ncbi:baseplate J/gp47 family protein (plasmid) [Clostridium estertheticum]|uniref:baseplate J/gp47 family protein n=1 Tax=Clostridium estertheticum TaxID=238834 RepID=UPI001C7D9EB4|nr:baseplate J/gp47 family protein [Clostridium estertheticum]MBX4259726.1 baseplate J/gp47 family protein [Clostridium estertheticum]WLC73313.1 baseplate J/gp47 family protein [Clostridium estertheticum]
MAYFAPFIDDTGFHMPLYTDIRDQLITDAKSIFGQDIYMGIDSQDYQFIAVVAEKIYDAFQTAMLVYNNRGPSTAIGSGLDSIIKINGLKRDAANYSICSVTVSGVPETVIKNCVVTDKGSIKWDLPSSITIPANGTLDVLATCEITGPIVANPGDITGIFTPTYGLSGVYNSKSGELGSIIESDSLVRVRQSNSTAQPSSSMLEGTRGAVAQVKGVTRSKVYENDTSIIDSNGLPGHSITAIVEGGSSLDIANAIFVHKGIGCLANGTTKVAVTDSTGQVTSIGFDIADYTDIDVVVNIKQLTGYTTATTKSIKTNLQTYLNSLEIGNDVSMSSLWGIALQAMPNLAIPMYSITSITASIHGGAQSSADVAINYDNVCRGNINYITANVV